MGLKYRLEIDGGVDLETAPLYCQGGTIVAGGIFKAATINFYFSGHCLELSTIGFTFSRHKSTNPSN